IAFDIEGGLGVETSEVLRGLEFPVGVGIGTGKAVPTPAGAGTEVSLEHIIATFDQVDIAGLTDSTCVRFPDPPETPNGFVRRSLNLQELDPSLPNRLIRGYVQTFGVGNPESGDPILLLCFARTSDGFGPTTGPLEEEEGLLGYPPLCNDADFKR